MKAIIHGLAVLLLAALSVNGEKADTVYFNGSILTMNDSQPRAEAVAVIDGRIVRVGNTEEVMKTRGRNTRLVDLQGKTLLPGFVDSHGHVMGGGLQALSANLLAPPDGEVTDIASLQETLRNWMAENADAVDSIQLVIGFGYDQAQLAELRHPTREDLDAVSTEVPIILIHQSGHIVAANSKALEVGGITADVPDPAGGVIRRKGESGEPSGVLEETAAFPLLLKLLSRVGTEGAETFIKAGTELWARYGYTTAQDGRSMPSAVQAMREAAEKGLLPIDVVSYVDVLVDRELILQEVSRTYENRFRVGGAKLTIDGSPQGFTAWRDRPYYDPVGDYSPGYVGYASVTEEQVGDAIGWAFENDIQILVHSNGEAASDQFIAYVEAATEKFGGGDRRTVLIHGQFLREDQVDSLQRLDIFPSLFPMHTFYWGDWHRDHTVGPVLSNNISPTGWCVIRGMKFGTHHDAPVAFPDSMRVLDATVTRRSRTGDILGPEHRVDVMTALKAMTIWPAWQHFEGDTKGSIETGKLADFVVLDRDPTTVDPEKLDAIQVVETIKEDVSIFRLEDGNGQAAGLRSGNQYEIAFTRALSAMESGSSPGSGHSHGFLSSCLCNTISQITGLIGGMETP